MEYKVYWSGIEYQYNEKSNDKQQLRGGFVYAFANGFDVREVLSKLLESLKQQELIPLEIEFISVYDLEMEWESPEQTKHYIELKNLALNSKDVIYDDFYAYENE